MMEKIIAKYDYVNGNEESESAIQHDLNSTNTSAFAKGLTLSALRNIVNTFIKKICVKDYVQKVPRFSPGTWMATVTMRDIAAIMRECIETGTISQSECQDCLFDLLLAMVRVGPGTSHYEVIEKLDSTCNMSEYLQNLKIEKLQQMVSALKEHTYIQEGNMSLKDNTSLINIHMPRLLKSLVVTRADCREPDIWSIFLDLFLFYLIHTGDVPDELHPTIEYCGDAIMRVYDKNPYKGYPHTKVLQQHVQKIGAFIGKSDFPRGKQLYIATRYVDHLNKMESDQLEAVWADLISLFKSVCSIKNIKLKDKSAIIDKFKGVFDRVDAKTLQKNHTVFEVWAVNVTVVIEKTEENGKVFNTTISRMVSDLLKKYKPTKGDEKYWFPLIKAVWKIPTKEMQHLVKDILGNSSLKRMWNWKENIQEAKDMIAIVEKLDLPTVEGEDYWELRNTNSHCGDAVKELIQMLQIQKIDHLIMADIGRMSLTHMEKKSVFANSMIDRYFDKADFEKVPDVPPEIIRRFEPLIKDTDYPWLDGWCCRNGIDIFQSVIKAYKSGDEMPDEVNQAVIRILDFCMGGDCELIDIENGNQTIWAILLQTSVTFTAMHCKSGTAEICLPLFEKILKFRHSDEKSMQEICINTMSLVANLSPAVCVEFVDTLLDWYIEEPSSELIQIFSRIVEIKPDALCDKMDKFIGVCIDDSDSYTIQTQMFYMLSTKKPEIFTQDLIDMLMEHHILDQQTRIQILMIVMNVSNVNPQLVDKHMDTLMSEKYIKAHEQYFINRTLVNVAKTNEKFKDLVFNYLMKVLNIASDETQTTVTIIALKDICVRYGRDMFVPHKDYILQRRNQEHNANIQGQLTALIDHLEGRSLETVAQDIKETQEDVDHLDTRVTGTEGAVETLTTRVDQHEDDIQELGETVNTVTQRVDFAEKDIEETKVKVEEVDNKTMTNAPRWSRDLTKLMNPSNEHDWRLLAQRLGYSNDDIRAWASQHDPCMAVLSEWYATHKTREATYAVLTALQEMDRMDGAAIVENAMKASVDVVEDEEVEYTSPPPVFLSYQWGHQDEVKLIRNHLQMAGYECWMDIGQMGGGDKLFEKIDSGIRGAKVIICCVSEKYAKSPNCNREVSLSVNLGKPMIPLLMENMSWPPIGSMGPIFSEYLFIRFFQRAGEETDDNRVWPVAKFQEMLMQLNCYGIKPEESLIEDMYRKWWIPVQEIIVIDTAKKKENQLQVKVKEQTEEEKKSPDVFISYQWGKQKQIIALYQRLTRLGLSCWMDIHQMGGGDSLYEKIDSGVRGCKVVLTCVTQKYSFSANCRREVSLADALKKPIIPLLLEKIDWPPTGPMSMVFSQILFINFYCDEEVQMKFTGPKFDALLDKIEEQLPVIIQHGNNGTQPDSQHDEKTNNQHDNSGVLQNEEQDKRSSNLRQEPIKHSPSPVKSDEPVVIKQTDINAVPTTTQNVQNREQNADANKRVDKGDTSSSKEFESPEDKKSKSCTIL